MRRKMDAAFNILYKPIFFQEIPALQNMLICKIIQQSWHNELSIQKHQGKLATFLEEYIFLQVTLDLKCQKVKLRWNVPWEQTQMSRYIFEETVSLSEQTKIQRTMELYALNLTKEFADWISLHSIMIFWDITLLSSDSALSNADSFSYPVVELLRSFEEFVYDIYGRIDYVGTAKNLLMCAKLTPYQKFILACVYCFEKEVEQLWPSVQTQLRPDESEIESDKVVQYWITRMTNQLNSVPLQYNPSELFSQSMSYSAMKYFWNDIKTFDEKVNCIGLCFERANSFGVKLCMDYWFPKMNEEFLKCVISRYGTIIMTELIQSLISRKFMLSFWQHTGDMFDGDQFVKILEGMNFAKFRDFRLICRVLWCNAPTKLQTHALDYYQVEDSFDPFNNLMKKIIARNPYNINNGGGILLLPSDCIYYPNGCECENDPEGENCKCKTLLQ